MLVLEIVILKMRGKGREQQRERVQEGKHIWLVLSSLKMLSFSYKIILIPELLTITNFFQLEQSNNRPNAG